MAWSSHRKTGPNQKPSYTRKNSGEIDPWCLTCGVNVRVDGVSYVTLSRHKTADLCDTFTRVLGAEFSESYASLDLCNRCERQLRRLGRYNSIILARNEGKKLRDQLERNLAKYGQTVLVSGDDFSTSPPKPSSSTIASSSAHLKRGKSSELSPGRKKLGDFSNRSSSVNSEKLSSAADVKGLEHDGRPSAGFRKSFGDSSNLDYKKKSLIPHYIEEEKRWESRRHKFSKSPSTSEESGLPSEKGNIEKKPLQKNTSSQQNRIVSFRDESLRDNSNTKDRDEALIEDMETNDKTALVEANEQPDNNNIREVSKKKNFGFKSTKEAHAKKAASTVQSQISETDDNKTNANRRNIEDKEHCSDRINPFNVDASRNRAADSFESTLSFEDDVFVKDIIDLDEVSGQQKDNNSTGHESIRTVDSEQIRSDLMSGLDGKNFRDFSRASSTSVDTSDVEVDPNDYNADNRSSLSEVEERINIKTQFKGAYYNIGSTEDLLQEFESELAADRARMHKLTPVTSIDKEDSSGPDKLPNGGVESTAGVKKGKITKYESLDLDLQTNNPFYDDVYSEYKRRVKAKRIALPCKNSAVASKIALKSKSKVPKSIPQESIPEVDLTSVEENSPAEKDDSHVTCQTQPGGSVEVSSYTGREITGDVAMLVTNHTLTGKYDQDNAPLIDGDSKEEDKENECNKPDLTDLEEPFFDEIDNLEDDNLMLSDIGSTGLGTGQEKQEVTNVDEKEIREHEAGLVDAKEVTEVTNVANGVLTETVTKNPLNEEISLSEVVETDITTERKEIQDDYQSIPAEGTPITKKSEKSPLISADLKVKGGKEKFKDQEPGLLCCTIL
ncbi:hypothetical protein Btru_037539 [Bulinus truncatus]|nr:hypothetical protein Btru_037539 [Bulinus truncatus]